LTKRYLVVALAMLGALALAFTAAIAVWLVRRPETPERCIERFEQLIKMAPDPGVGPIQPIFTYDVTRMEGVLEHFVGQGSELEGLRGTIVHGPSDAALEEFYGAEVPPKGAVLSADDFSLFRTRGTPGSRAATLAEGCRETPPDARLVHIQWIALPAAAP
jgi:hypothetical protein